MGAACSVPSRSPDGGLTYSSSVLLALKAIGSENAELRARASATWRRHSGSRGSVESWGAQVGRPAVVGTCINAMNGANVSLETIIEAAGFLAYYGANDKLLRDAVVASRVAAVPVLMRVVERVTYIPESTACDVFDLLLTMLSNGTPAGRDSCAALVARAWPVSGFVIAQPEC